ncbi:MAG: squalene/phytoene synthase family protein [Rhodospirillales bacterium]|nr:squalene/phytoene synthase family protein [Rhodospirillales bacterium]
MNDALAALVRRHDPDRFLTALFAAPERRDALLALYAFNHELARAREVASEPTLALIRLQWWREVVEGAPKRHEIATPLSAAIATGALLPPDLLAMIDAREVEAEPGIETQAEWDSYLMAGAGGVSVAAARLLGAPHPEAFRPYGAAYGAAGLLRSVPVLARVDRCLLPLDLLAAQGLSPEAAIADPGSAEVAAVITHLRRTVSGWLDACPRRVNPRAAIAAALPAVLARRDLRRIGESPRPRGIGDRAAVTLAALTGRLS